MAAFGNKPFRIVLGIVIGFLLLYLLFGNLIIKTIAEAKMTEAYGGEVNIGKVKHTLFPTTVTMRDIEVTNLGKPSHNQVKIGTASADVALLPLLSNQIIVDNLAVLDVEFNTARTSPGKVLRAPSRALTFDEIKQQAAGAIPSVDELIERNPLRTTQALEAAKQAYTSQSQTLKDMLDTLPDQTTIAQYRQQIDEIKRTDLNNPSSLLEAKTSFETLKQTMSQDKQQLQAFAERVNEAKKTLNSALQSIQQAKDQDMSLMRNLIAGDSNAMKQITYFVFGDKAQEYTQYLTSVFNVVMPMLNPPQDTGSAGDGPSVLIRHADISVLFGNDKLTSVLKNVTDAHTTFGQPTTFSIAGAGQRFKQFTSDGQFWIDEAGVDASQSWNISGLSLDDVRLNQSDTLSATLAHALLKAAGSVTVSDNQLSGKGSVDMRDLALLAQGQGKQAEAIAKALSSLSSLSLSMLFDGRIDDPELSLSSDLDNQLAAFLVSELTESQTEKVAQVQSKINAMIADDQQQLNEQLSAIDAMLGKSENNASALDGLLKTQLSSLVETKKDSLLNKLKGKLGQ